ncbi:hypothetical protein L1987_19844 [Smallanthus sonchifolius]|uniref:Uncharacterized protein n=1 Tax=Smallanthus sonchifolius TaxID=185202 RepID=A0ACB9IPR3_9ASTR|nr:hypothetical protein L1987_19844 [Smallanthus sonchifolius]
MVKSVNALTTNHQHGVDERTGALDENRTNGSNKPDEIEFSRVVVEQGEDINYLKYFTPHPTTNPICNDVVTQSE